jgi:uncharacterized protein
MTGDPEKLSPLPASRHHHRNPMTPHLLDLPDRPLVNDYLRRYPPRTSELTFTNLYAWRQTRPILVDIFKESLIFFAETRKGRVVFGKPAGPVSLAEVIDEYEGTITGVDRYPGADIDELRLPSGAKVVEDRDNADYVYLRAALASLAGRNYTKKRNRINQCLAAYSCTYEEITPELVPQCLAMQDRWCTERDCKAEPGLCGEYQAIEETLLHFQDFGLTGGAIRIDGTIEAFTIGEALNPSTAVCHFEKAMSQFHGLGQLINQRFAENNLAGFTHVNREQDLGIPGLRQSKESYYPDHLVPKVRIFLPGAGGQGPEAPPPPIPLGKIHGR